MKIKQLEIPKVSEVTPTAPDGTPIGGSTAPEAKGRSIALIEAQLAALEAEG